MTLKRLVAAVLAVLLLAGLTPSCSSSVVVSETHDDDVGRTISKEVVDEDILRVHVIPHSHDDVGWLKTVDQYTTGMNNTIYKASTNNILDSVIEELQRDDIRTFVYSEQGFFQRWWRARGDAEHNAVRRLTESGRLEWVNGGWCMHDEATTHYVAMVDQTTLGHAFLKEQLGVIPTTGWQLDPFGHSATQASLLSSAAGFTSLFFGRSDYRELQKRKKDNATEMIWKPTSAPRGQPDLFTVAMDFEMQEGTYGPPSGFSFDETSTDDPVQDDMTLEQYNVGERVRDFEAACLEKASFIQGNNIMWMFGNDFNYQYAAQNYQNMDKLLRAVNANGRMIAFYSTPARYVEAKLKEVQQQEQRRRQEERERGGGHDAEEVADADDAETIAYPIKRDDFFPYADQAHAYWTGYFTSRPTHKFYNRYASAYLQTARQIHLLGMISKGSNATEREHHFAPLADDPIAFVAPNEPSVTAPLSEALGLSQHHDAITGTGKQHVTSDWARRIGIGMDVADATVSAVMRDVVDDASTWTNSTNRTATVQAFAAHESWLPCHMLNVSHCDPLVAMKTDGVVTLSLFNTLGRTRTETMKLPMPSIDDYTTTYVVTDKSNGSVVPSRVTLLPGTAATAEDTNVEFGRQLEFQPTVPPLGAALFEIRRQEKPHRGLGERLDLETEKPARMAPRKVLTYSPSSSRAIVATEATVKSSWFEAPTKAKDILLENEYLKLHVSGDTGHALQLENKESGVTVKFEQDFAFYKSYVSQPDMDELLRSRSGERETTTRQMCPLSGDEDDKINDKDSGSNQNSGTYIFRNNGTIIDLGLSSSSTNAGTRALPKAPESFELLQDLDDTSSVVGIVQRWSDYIYQTISLARGARYVEFEYKVGPIPVDDFIGKEVVTRYRANIMSNATLYTDSNGRNMVERVRNARASYDIDGCKDEPVSCNYYPVTTAAYIKDSASQLTVLTDRAQGAASLTDGELEFMLHRRILVDDNRGVAEPLNETDAGMSGYPDWKREGDGIVVIGRHRVLLGEPGDAARDWKPAMQSMFSTLTPLFGSPRRRHESEDGNDGVDSQNASSASISGPEVMDDGNTALPSMLLSAELPPSLDVMTLQAISPGQVLLRIQHMFEEGEVGGGLGDCVDLDVGAHFAALKIKTVTAMSLTNNQKKADMYFPTWGRSARVREGTGDGDNATRRGISAENELLATEEGSSFTICPMEVHTFLLDLDL